MSDLRNKLVALGLSGALLLAGVLTGTSEGEVKKVYADPVGIPTACYGHTGRDMKPGAKYTDDECVAILAKDLRTASADVDRLVKAPIGEGMRAALIDFQFNTGKLAGSTLLRKVNAHDPTACAEFEKWKYAGGHVLPGLVTRREAERAYCEGRSNVG